MRSEDSANKVHVNSGNSKKEYHHHLGKGGYKSAIPRCKNMEQGLLDRGIIPTTIYWPDRSENWYYAHGGTLSPEHGTLIFNETIREKAPRLIKNIKDSKVGKFKLDRENNELTLVLGNPEHPGLCRGFRDNQWYPVDDITQRTSCELYRPFGNLTIKVAYGSALPILPRQTSHGMAIPPGYSTVGVDHICDSKYEDLELDLPAGDSERTLKDALHSIILWCKRYIIIAGQEGASFLPIDPLQPPSP
ncbi:uncharacterized protein [Setaria viridis]|uniref:uncharacterized protein n=1 Tax=Setaria viridis TaxID=4556 RepID=UPI003B3A3F2D